MSAISRLSDADFATLCHRVLAGFGIKKPSYFEARGVELAFRLQLVRESTDKMFRADEIWLCTFIRPAGAAGVAQVKALADAAVAAGVHFVLVVIFGAAPFDAGDRLRQRLSQQGIELALLAGLLAESLAADAEPESKPAAVFSFSSLRRHLLDEVDSAPWRKHFQTASVQPGRVLPLQVDDAALAEADLVRVLHGGSFLLLGEPGAGKTTSLLALARELAAIGPYTPVVLPLGRYHGDFWDILCEALAPGGTPVQRSVAQALVESGALVLLLDGINEVQSPDLQSQLVEELNRLTDPDEPTARSRWVVSGRIHDYQRGHQHLLHLEARRWEVQPFTADLVFRVLADTLGEPAGLALYNELGEAVRDLCSNPLLLNMVLTVYARSGRAPAGRGALYRQFVALLLEWGDDRQLHSNERETLTRLWPEPLTAEGYQTLAREALTALASAMSSTQVPWRDAQRQIARTLSRAYQPEQAAAVLLDDLTRRGLLRSDHANRVSFFHHTFQEYFHALELVGRHASELIPEDGVAAVEREAVVFLAGLLDDPTPLVERALKTDLALAFDIVRDAPSAVPSNLVVQLARSLWSRIWSDGRFVGAGRPWARLFKRIATIQGRTVEDLAAEVDAASAVARTGHLIRFYGHLDDPEAQRQALATVVGTEGVPQSLLFVAALVAFDSRDFQRAVDLYTRYLEDHPLEREALGNRAGAYRLLGRNEEALADYQASLERYAADPLQAVIRSNYGSFLIALGRKDEAREHLLRAIELDPTYAFAHERIATLLEATDPESALEHREQSVRFAPHEEALRDHLAALADLQEKLARHAGAIRTLRRMIALNPTSPRVRTWKQRIATQRQALESQARTRSVRERLQDQNELPLPTLVVEWLKAAGFEVEHATSAWVLARREAAGPLPVLLMPEPRVTAAGLRAALESVRRQAWDARQILVVTAAERLEQDALHQRAALQDELTLGLVTALEVRDALLQNDVECRHLLDRILNRSQRLDDPFDYKGIVRETAEFFGRAADIADLTARLGQGRQVGLYGIHKIGKSSLMEQLRRTLHISHPEITVVQIELDGHGHGAADFYGRVLEKLPGATELPHALGVTATAFRRALTDYHRRREQEQSGHRVLLVVDEYAFLIPDAQGRGGWPGFLEVLGLLKTLHQEGWFLLLPCGRSAALNRQAGWKEGENPFIDLLHPCFLGPLPREENDALMTTLGLRARLKFTPEALALIYEETAGHPSFSRTLGSQLLREGTATVSADRVRTAVEGFLKSPDQTSILRAIYESRMDLDEQELARQLALHGPQSRRSLFPVGTDTERRRQIRSALDNLLDTTVLTERPDGLIAHRYGLLRRIIKREAKELGFE